MPKEKLTGYLLSETHEGGRSKAKFFRSVGFNESNVYLLEKSLLEIAKSEELKNIIESVHGIKYVIDGKINTPSTKVVKVRTVWILEPNQKTPRFITTYPV